MQHKTKYPKLKNSINKLKSDSLINNPNRIENIIKIILWSIYE